MHTYKVHITIAILTAASAIMVPRSIGSHMLIGFALANAVIALAGLYKSRKA